MHKKWDFYLFTKVSVSAYQTKLPSKNVLHHVKGQDFCFFCAYEALRNQNCLPSILNSQSVGYLKFVVIECIYEYST